MRSRLALAALCVGVACPAMAEPPSKSSVARSTQFTPARATPLPQAEAAGTVAPQPAKALEPLVEASTAYDPPSKVDAESEATAVAKAEKPKPAAPSLIAKIDLTRQRLEVIADGKTRYAWPISSGAKGYETPRGTFRGQWMAKLWHSQKYELAPMPHAVFFHDSGVAIHATTSIGMLGRPASHGCVRLAPANAAIFYTLVQKHGLKATQVQVFGTEPVPPPLQVARREVPQVRQPTYNGQTVTYLPPGSPYAGRPSFVHNGVLYVRVR